MKAQIRHPLRHRISPALIITLAVPALHAASITWNMGTATPTSIDSAEVTDGTITQYNNNGTTVLLTTVSPSTGTGTYAGATGTNNAGAATRIGALNIDAGGSAAFEFTLVPVVGVTLTLSDLIFGSRSTLTGPQAWTLRSSANAYGTDITLGTLANNSAWSLQNAIDFSFAITAATTFRLFGYNGAGNPSTGTANWRIDDLQLIYSTGGTPTGRNLIWSPITGVWDLTVQNWTEVGIPGTPVAFQAADRTTFDDTGLANGSTVTIQAAGVTIGNTKVTNTTGTYTFVGGALSGSGTLTKTGAGRLVLSAANAYSGGTMVTEGTVVVSDDAQLGSVAAPLTLGTAGTLETTGSLTLNASRPVTGTGTLKIAPATTLNIAGPANTGPLTLTTIGSLLLSGAASAQIGGFHIQQPINLAAAQPILLTGPFTTTSAAGTVIVAAAINLGAATRIFTIADGSATTDVSVTGNLSSTGGSAKLHKLGDGTLEFLGDNTALIGGVRLGTAGIASANGGTIIVNNDLNLGPGGANAAGAFFMNAGTLHAASPIHFPAALDISFGNAAPFAARFTGADVEFLGAAYLFRSDGGTGPKHIIVADSNVRLASKLDNSGSTSRETNGLIIRGSGSLTLANGAKLTTTITIEGGKLIVIGDLTGEFPESGDNRPRLDINNAGTLAGSVSGSNAVGPVVVGAIDTPGSISPGTLLDSTDVLTISTVGFIPGSDPFPNALQMLSTGIFNAEIGGIAGGEFDQIVAFGTIQLAGTLNVSLINGYAPALGDSFTVILNDASEPIAGTFTDKTENSIFTVGSSFFRINYAAGDGNDVVLTAVVPEPGTAALLLGGLGLLGIRRRES